MQVTKTIRLAGSSPTSLEDAVSGVLGRAAMTLEDVGSFEVVRIGGRVDPSGVVSSFDVTIDITFVVKESVHG